jgi:hypothetical protein
MNDNIPYRNIQYLSQLLTTFGTKMYGYFMSNNYNILLKLLTSKIKRNYL